MSSAAQQTHHECVQDHDSDRIRPLSITAIGIPTRDRPATLRRLLGGLRDMLSRSPHPVDVLVLDDSASPEMQDRNRAIVASFIGDTDLRLRYGNRQTREQFVDRLAVQSGVPPDVVSFAFMGDSVCGVTTGAVRNTLLVEASGGSLLFLDDDIECKLIAIPGSTSDITFDLSNCSGRFFECAEDMAGYPITGDSVIEVHQTLLNTSRLRISIAAAHARSDRRTSPAFLQQMADSAGTVVVSLTGLMGDVGMDSPLPYYLQGSRTLSCLTRTEQLYRAALRNRIMLRGPRGVLIARDYHCMSGCMAVDHSELLPPFAPVFRCAEMVFGCLVSLCVPGALFGVAPRAVVHRPEPVREFAAGAAAVRAGRFTAGEILASILRTRPVYGSCEQERILSAAQTLLELADDDRQQYDRCIRAVIEPLLVSHIRQLTEVLTNASPIATFWTQDVHDIRTAYVSSLRTGKFSIPLDVESNGGAMDGQARFHMFLRHFSSVLKHWPLMVEEAKALHADGHAICQPVAA